MTLKFPRRLWGYRPKDVYDALKAQATLHASKVTELRTQTNQAHSDTEQNKAVLVNLEQALEEVTAKVQGPMTKTMETLRRGQQLVHAIDQSAEQDGLTAELQKRETVLAHLQEIQVSLGRALRREADHYRNALADTGSMADRVEGNR